MHWLVGPFGNNQIVVLDVTKLGVKCNVVVVFKQVLSHVHLVAHRLQHQKLWQNGRHKQYYTRLTKILREYLDGRYGVSAMEMTTDEILAAIKELSIDARQFAVLTELLQTADFVKFAKHTPDDELNESLFSGVYYFVEDTKQVNPDDENNEYKEAMKV